jgi:proliferating cell nuclear antigen
MMNITARQDTIRIIVDILSTLVEEARFNFNADNLEIRVVDPSHVAMIRMEIDKSAFESWEVDETVLGLELSKLSKLVSLAGTGDLLEINFDEGFGRVNINVGEIGCHHASLPQWGKVRTGP